MKDKDILDMLGLNDRTITLSADDEYLQITLERKIDNYLKKLDEEKKIIAYKIGKQYVVKEQDLNNYLDSGKYER